MDNEIKKLAIDIEREVLLRRKNISTLDAEVERIAIEKDTERGAGEKQLNIYLVTNTGEATRHEDVFTEWVVAAKTEADARYIFPDGDGKILTEGEMDERQENFCCWRWKPEDLLVERLGIYNGNKSRVICVSYING